MSFTLWRGVVGMVRPTRRPGTLEELIRLLPEGIGIVPLLLNFKAGSTAEFKKSIPQYERFVAELAEQAVDLIILSGAPPFMLLGYEGEARLIRQWEKKYKIADRHRPADAGCRAARDEDQEIHRRELFGTAEQDRAGLHGAGRPEIRIDGADRRSLRPGRADLHARCFTRTSRGCSESIPARTASISRAAAGRPRASSQMLETDLQVPVVHATICQAWVIHKRLRVRETTPGYGRLLAELP